MRRKFAVIGFSSLIGLFFASVFIYSKPFIVAAVTVLLISAVLLLIFKNEKLITVCLFSAATGIASFAACYYIDSAAASSVCNGKTYILTAVVKEKTDIGNDSSRFCLSSTIDGRQHSFILFTDDINISAGDTVKLEAEFSLLKNTARFSTADYYMSDGIFLSAKAKSDITAVSNGSPGIIGMLREYNSQLARILDILYPDDDGALMKAIFLGDKNSLGDIAEYNIHASGGSHLTAVSGMHLSMIISIIAILISAIGAGRLPAVKIIIIIVFIVLLTVFFGFTVSVVRSGIMLISCYCGKLFFRKSDCLNSIGIAILIITIPNPLAVLDAGFILTVSATIGAGVLAPALSDEIHVRLYRLNKGICDLLCSSVCASLITLPLSAAYFGCFSVYSCIVTAAVLPFMTIAMLSLILFGIFAGCLPFLAAPAHLCCTIMNGIFRFFASLPFSHFVTDSAVTPHIIIVSSVLVAVITIAVHRKKRIITASAGCIGIFVSLVITYILLSFNPDIKLTVIASGDGKNGSVLILSDEYNGAVITGGAKTAEKLYAEIKSRNIGHLDFLALCGGNEYPLEIYNELFSEYTDILTADNNTAALAEQAGLFENSVKKSGQYTECGGIIFDIDNNSLSLTVNDTEVYFCNAGRTKNCAVNICFGSTGFIADNGGLFCFTDKNQKNLPDNSIELFYTDAIIKINSGGRISAVTEY